MSQPDTLYSVWSLVEDGSYLTLVTQGMVPVRHWVQVTPWSPEKPTEAPFRAPAEIRAMPKTGPVATVEKWMNGWRYYEADH